MRIYAKNIPAKFHPDPMKFGTTVPLVNKYAYMHRLTESDFLYDVTLSRWRPWRHRSSGLALAGHNGLSIYTSWSIISVHSYLLL